MSDGRTFVVVPASAPRAYWEDYATIHSTLECLTDDGRQDVVHALRTLRTGEDGRSDARYLRDRLASGLHPAKLAVTAHGASEAAYEMADILFRTSLHVRKSD